jgi:hypothetical protein
MSLFCITVQHLSEIPFDDPDFPDYLVRSCRQLLLADPAIAPHGGGVLVIDDSATATASRQRPAPLHPELTN